MENNLENKARFFAQYYGVKALYVGGVGVVRIGYGGWNLKHPDFFLELTPLSEISDEDAIEVCCKKESTYDGFEVIEISKNNLDVVVSFKWKPTKKSNMDYWHSANSLYFNCLFYRDYQYLQLKGYALPFHDLSVEDLINYGWIKLKTK